MYRKTGFTLIELLVVISIIALLLSILMPSLQTIRQQAQGTVCSTNIRGLTMSWLLYAEDNNGKIVGGFTGPTEHPYYSWVGNPSWEGAPIEEKKEAIKQGLLYDYTEEVDVYHCPSDKRSKGQAATGGVGAFRSYSIPGGLNGVEYPPSPLSWGLYPHTKANTIRRPGEKYVFVEENDPIGYNKDSWKVEPRRERWVDVVSVRHNGKSPLAFADGHSETHKWNKDTIAMAEKAEIEGRDYTFDWAPAEGFEEDLEYMTDHYAFVRLFD